MRSTKGIPVAYALGLPEPFQSGGDAFRGRIVAQHGGPSVEAPPCEVGLDARGAFHAPGDHLVGDIGSPPLDAAEARARADRSRSTRRPGRPLPGRRAFARGRLRPTLPSSLDGCRSKPLHLGRTQPPAHRDPCSHGGGSRALRGREWHQDHRQGNNSALFIWFFRLCLAPWASRHADASRPDGDGCEPCIGAASHALADGKARRDHAKGISATPGDRGQRGGAYDLGFRPRHGPGPSPRCASFLRRITPSISTSPGRQSSARAGSTSTPFLKQRRR
jgi:hypothetical protein